MANLINKIYLFIILFLIYACSQTTPRAKKPELANKKDTQNKLKGIFQSIKGGEINLSNNPNQIKILMFVSETCSVCRKETIELVEEREIRGSPRNVDFYSILVGSYLEDAIDWKESLNVNWDVGIDEGDLLFREFCPELKTPCMILTNPQSGKSFQLIGDHSIEELETLTGKWEY